VPVIVNTKRTWTPPPPPSSCTAATPGAQCCQNVENSSNVDSWTEGVLEGLLDVDISTLNIPIGTGCTPVAILGGVSCNKNTVCCGQTFQGQCSFSTHLIDTILTLFSAESLIGINCVPVIANV
jgi:hypothetical protein